MEPFEEDLRRRGIEPVAGIDEVGRGALFGPVMAAAVVLPPDVEIEGLADSKQLTPGKREDLFVQLQSIALDWAVGLASAVEIDRLNILEATRLAMRRAVAGLRVRPRHLLIDALRLDDVDIPQTSIVKGDARCRSIAAASIAAKCTRDALVRAYARSIVGYGLERNMGYGTRQHLDAVLLQGHSPLHRRSFRIQGSLPFDEGD